MKVFHSHASCHLGITRVLQMPELFYWRIGMHISVRWWPRHCCRETFQVIQFTGQLYISRSRMDQAALLVLTILAPSPGLFTSNAYLLLFIGHFSRHVVMYAVSESGFTAEGAAIILINKYIPLPDIFSVGKGTAVYPQTFASFQGNRSL